MDAPKRIQLIIDTVHDGVAARFCEKTGFQSIVVSRWLNGERKISRGSLFKISSKYSNLSQQFIVYGLGGITKTTETHQNVSKPPTDSVEARVSPSPMLDRGTPEPTVLLPQTPEKLLYSDKDMEIAELKKDTVIKGLEATIKAQREEIARAEAFQTRVGEALKKCEQIQEPAGATKNA